MSLRSLLTIVIVAALLFLFACWVAAHAQVIAGVCYASKCRSTTQTDRFKRLTGFPHGRPGYIINHMRPLHCHGADLPSNMVWEDSAFAHLQDRVELDCSAYIPFDTTQLDSMGRAIIR